MGLPPLDLPLHDGPDFSLDIDLNPKDMMELEEFDFDFEEINDLGSWIATSDDSLSEEVMGVDSVNSENERLQHFEDLDIKEAVRYDCMWTSYNEFNAQKSHRNSNNSSPTASLNLSSSSYDSLLGSIDTPENSDCSSIKSEMETDTDSEESEKRKAKTEVKTEEKKEALQTMSPAHIITSLDHCYNISSTHLDNERFLPRSSSGPLTPPVSSDDEDCNNSSSTNFAFSNINYKSQARNEKGLKQSATRRVITTSNKAHTQSLLKRSMNSSRQRTLSEAKFSINLKVNRQIVKQADKSRSLLKQKVKIVRTPFANTKPSSTESQLKKKLFEQHRTSQSAMRKRKERSLKMQEGEAREVHNQMERQRRNELKVALPEIATSDKASKQQILDKAVETCLNIRSTESSLKTRVTTLNKTNSQLKERLRKLQAEAKRRRDFPMGIADW